MLEAQLKYIVEGLLYMDAHRVRSMVVKEIVHDRYNRWIQSKLRKTVWTLGGCQSWYRNAEGNVTTLWPDFTWMYHRLMRQFDAESYVSAY